MVAQPVDTTNAGGLRGGLTRSVNYIVLALCPSASMDCHEQKLGPLASGLYSSQGDGST